MTICKNCGKTIKWFKDPVNDKWMPLESDCDLEYDNQEDVNMDEVAEWRHKCAEPVLRCNKGCVPEVYFDPNNKSRSGKLNTDGGSTHENHTCSDKATRGFWGRHGLFCMTLHIMLRCKHARFGSPVVVTIVCIIASFSVVVSIIFLWDEHYSQ